MIHAILFDFNGVIVDDEGIQCRAYRQVFECEGFSMTEEEYLEGLGMDDRTFVGSQLTRAGRAASEELIGRLIEAKTAVHRELIGNAPPLFAGVVTFLKAAAREMDIGLVSMARREEIDFVLERSGLEGLFGVVVSAGETRAHKPDPACFVLGLKRLNERRRTRRLPPLLPHECLAVEDSPPGVEAARSAGMRVVGVTNTVEEHALRSAGANVVTHSLADWTIAAVHHLLD